jgi:hypothetical protein
MKLARGKTENGAVLPRANLDLRVIDSECQGKKEPGKEAASAAIREEPG